MTSKREQTPTTAADFLDLAKQIRSIADNYESIAKTMESRGIDSIDVLGMETLNTVTMLRMTGPLASAQRALAANRKKTKSAANELGASVAAEIKSKYRKGKKDETG